MMTTKKGTPKTMVEAIENGFTESFHHVGNNKKCLEMEIHVRDFLAQRFAALMLQSSEDQQVVLDKFFIELFKKPEGWK